MSTEPTVSREGREVPHHARLDVIGGGVMVFIAALVWYGAIGLRVGGIMNFGPGAMPKALAILLFAAGAAILIHGLTQRAEDAEALTVAIRPPAILAIAILLFGVFIRGGEFWIVSTPRLGLMVVGPLTVFVAGFATPQANWRELVVLALGLTAAALLVFSDFLGMPIPVFPNVVADAIPPSFGAAAAVRVVYAFYGMAAALLYLTLLRFREKRGA